jgi:hypothetical protein
MFLRQSNVNHFEKLYAGLLIEFSRDLYRMIRFYGHIILNMTVLIKYFFFSILRPQIGQLVNEYMVVNALTNQH